MTNTNHAQELDLGRCFAFRKNWANLLNKLNEERISEIISLYLTSFHLAAKRGASS